MYLGEGLLIMGYLVRDSGSYLGKGILYNESY